MAMIQSKKYTGVYLNPLLKNDITYYVGFHNGKAWQKIKIGKKTEGITENYANTKRLEYIHMTRLGEDPMAHKKQIQKTVLLFDTVATEYFTHIKSDRIIKDTYNPENRYKNHIFSDLGNKDITKITRTDILAIQHRMSITRSKATTQQIISLISSIYKFAINSDNVLYTGKNICEGLMQGRKLDNSRLRYLDKKEVAILLEAVKDDTELDLFVRLSLSTGGRLMSILNIKAKDIFNENVSIYNFKNEKTYSGFISKSLLPDKKFLDGLKPNDYLIGRSSEEYSFRKIQRNLKEIMDSLFNKGLDTKDSQNRVVPHSLRHTFASLLVINGTPIYEVMKLMSHSSIDITMRYAKLAPDSGQNAVDNII